MDKKVSVTVKRVEGDADKFDITINDIENESYLLNVSTYKHTIKISWASREMLDAIWDAIDDIPID